MNTSKLSGWLLWLTLTTAQAVELQPIATIQTAVHDFVAGSLNPTGKQQIDVMALDAHLQLPLCDQELEINSTTGDIKAGRNTLLVQCKGSQTWKIYSSATVRIYKEVLVLARPLRRNDVIHAEDVVLENREISTLTQGYLLDSADIVNKQAARNLLPGSVLNQQSYQDLTLVKRGDRVSIQLGKGGMNISMAGIAMTNGAKGERINVRNISSQKLVQAVVVDTAQVSVNF